MNDQQGIARAHRTMGPMTHHWAAAHWPARASSHSIGPGDIPPGPLCWTFWRLPGLAFLPARTCPSICEIDFACVLEAVARWHNHLGREISSSWTRFVTGVVSRPGFVAVNRATALSRNAKVRRRSARRGGRALRTTLGLHAFSAHTANQSRLVHSGSAAPTCAGTVPQPRGASSHTSQPRDLLPKSAKSTSRAQNGVSASPCLPTYVRRITELQQRHEAWNPSFAKVCSDAPEVVAVSSCPSPPFQVLSLAAWIAVIGTPSELHQLHSASICLDASAPPAEPISCPETRLILVSVAPISLPPATRL